ncbi:DUF2809 domain-containing protein [Flavobacteriaceae bacterium TP-CH-4]|uniref:DUF2809 domain-containing protein n=1 Tax=Pelagihabitans pacificus TaxID=2696054 RepID=A0A967AWZ7_9FLAO|nr:DUF2809 domain-containing protein [Pelagihabitans pacificus]NHF58136.1 DUF2809 domain-containing protein [Pelagihabitans pacificus]
MIRFVCNKKYLLFFILLFLIEAGIAYFLKSGFIRYTVGDFLVVILLYCFLKGFLKGNSRAIALVTLGIAYTVEFLQATNFLGVLGLKQHQWAHLVFGNSFSIQDLVAYTLGILLVIYLENRSPDH